MNLKYRLKKIKIKLRQRFSKEKFFELDSVQEKVYNIVIKMIQSKNSELFYDPLNSRFFIKNDDIFISILRPNICISNGKNYYDVYINDSAYDNLIKKFKEKLTRKINALESQMKSGIKSNMELIINSNSNK